ncbi:MAG: 4-(cytidine 5'-diphospho)-2-C-methyl-D-erythritol kinase [Pseudomonadota bacterium]
MTSRTHARWRAPDFAWPAPAKLNLFLHITGRRADGYHELQTIFQFINVCDDLYFQTRDDGAVQRLNDLPGVPAEQDLTVRAARLLQQYGAASRGVDIRVAKRLPMGGGLGGGSSDAATALVALNALWDLGMDTGSLAGIGRQLGADVPIFVYGHAAWAEGVGEIFTPVELPEPWYVVIAPAVSVSTAEIFNAPELTRTLAPIKIRHFLEGQTRNVCEPVVRRRYPQVDDALKWLENHGDARMTGTGACVYAAFPDEARARGVAACAPVDWRVVVAQGQNISPLQRIFQGA